MPSYQWNINSILSIPSILSIHTYNPANSYAVSCIMTSNPSCVTGNPATSAKIVMSGTLAPIVSFASCFDTVTTVNAKDFKLKGGLPLGGTYSGPGINSITGTFTPSVAGTGLKTINYTYTNVAACSAAKSKTILVLANPPFICGNTLADIRDGTSYPTVLIGTQCWMSSNLDFGFTILDLVPQTDNCKPEKYFRPSSLVLRPSSLVLRFISGTNSCATKPPKVPRDSVLPAGTFQRNPNGQHCLIFT
ncbi:MAG: hypothetical protein NT004_10650, partial [Bacteroidetes bacterium]|nr:hypothetical protein [Bacteroidota bacterium]